MTESLQVSRVYYINLDQRPDRNEHILRLMQECPWPYSRIQAVRLQVTPEEAGYRLAEEHQDCPHVASIFLSHRKALHAALEAEFDGLFVVLEDDVQISSKLYLNPVPVPADLPEDWDVILVSVRYREPVPEGEVNRDLKWVRKPFGGRLVPAMEARQSFIVTGTHFCVFRNKSSVKNVIRQMDVTKELEDVDKWYMENTKCFVWQNDYVGTNSALGSNHNDCL